MGGVPRDSSAGSASPGVLRRVSPEVFPPTLPVHWRNRLLVLVRAKLSSPFLVSPREYSIPRVSPTSGRRSFVERHGSPIRWCIEDWESHLFAGVPLDGSSIGCCTGGWECRLFAGVPLDGRPICRCSDDWESQLFRGSPPFISSRVRSAAVRGAGEFDQRATFCTPSWHEMPA